jgi:predicted phosphodiesterase
MSLNRCLSVKNYNHFKRRFADILVYLKISFCFLSLFYYIVDEIYSFIGSSCYLVCNHATMLAIKVNTGYSSGMLRGLPRFSRVKRLLLAVVFAGLLILWLTAELILQGIHKIRSNVTYQAWNNGWLGCGWRKTSLLTYWNSTHVAVTGETSCRLPEQVWFLWREQASWSLNDQTTNKFISPSNWKASTIDPIIYDDHHYVYRAYVPVIPANINNLTNWMATKYSYLWRWGRQSTSDTASMSIGTTLPADLTRSDVSTPEDSFTHYHGMPATSSFTDKSIVYQQLNIAMVADNQYKKTKYLQILRRMTEHQPNFWLHGGDAVQHGASLAEWETDFFNPIIEAKLNRIPLLYTRGNHDDTRDNWDWGTDLGHIYHQPSRSWFAITLGGARWIVLDSNRDSTEQETFLREELTSKEAEMATFVIVVVHVPPYIEYWDREAWEQRGERYWGRFVLEKYSSLLEKHHVDLVISGHQHNYQRGQRDNTTYTIIGGGGGDLDDEQVTDWHMYKKTAITHHYAVVTLSHDKLVWNMYDTKGVVLDTFEIASRK